MAVIGSVLPTLADLTKRLDPDGKIAAIGEWLTQSNPILDDIVWQEGNLPTGERTTIRTELPTVALRALNEGVPRSKSRTAQVDDGAAMLEGNSQCDRKLAILSGDIGAYRLSESSAFLEAMNQTMAGLVVYGNAATNPKAFTGLAPRFNSLSGPYGQQVIDAGGTGTDNSSIYLVGWGAQGVKGIYPKGTKAGLLHHDLSAHTGMGDDGYPLGVEVLDADGNPYIGYKDHYEWNAGLSVKDPGYVVRIANIDKSLLSIDGSTGAVIQRLMVTALETIKSTETAGMKFGWYMPRQIRAMLRQQLLEKKNAFLSYEEVGGRKVTAFEQIPVRRIDAMKADEARVV
ncbi:MAG: major capsid protein [Sphingobium sp.]|uniref:major capsid protein n=1 Tax=Sphingobium sp. TaxID=1912891 RepID=UPI003BB0FFD7